MGGYLQPEPIQWPAPVLRVELRWDGKAWKVVNEVRVPSMTLPSPDELPAGERTIGFWVEAVDRDGRVRYRQIMADPLAGMEMFEEDGTITRLPHPAHDVSIEVLVPDLPSIAELHIVANPAIRNAKRKLRTVLKLHGSPAGGNGDDGGDGHGPH